MRFRGALWPVRVLRSAGVLSVLQVVGLLLVVDGIADWSRPAAKIVLGLAVIAVTVVWSIRGERDGDERA